MMLLFPFLPQAHAGTADDVHDRVRNEIFKAVIHMCGHIVVQS